MRITSMTLEVRSPLAPMEALSVDVIPEGEQWQYEPKWTVFAASPFATEPISNSSRRRRNLARYFPDVAGR